MNKILYFLPIIILIFGCTEEPLKTDETQQFKTVFGLVRTFENGQVAGIVGDTSKNQCSPSVKLSYLSYPNPTAFGVTIDFNINENSTVDLSLETAKGDQPFLDSLSAIRFPTPIYVSQHSKYSKEKIFSGELRKGSNSLHLDLKDYKTGLYYLVYEDSNGNNGCYPLLIQRYED